MGRLSRPATGRRAAESRASGQKDEDAMKRFDPIRTAFTAAALTAAPAALADTGGISTSGWMSVLGVLGVVGVLFWVYRKTS
jgi:LPXTG-motif cell wall-anchored protein